MQSTKTIHIYSSAPDNEHVQGHASHASFSLSLAENERHSLAQIIWTDGRLAPPPLCSGLGRCGRCRIQFIDAHTAPSPQETELSVLGEQAIQQGWRLACRHQAEDGMRIMVPAYQDETKSAGQGKEKAQFHNTNVDHAHTAIRDCYLAVDLGTTSLHWSALLPSGDVVASASMLNPQMGAGSDVMSRIAYASTEAGRKILRGLVIKALRIIQDELASQGFCITELCIAGNTAMTAIMADVSVHSLAGAPYAIPYAGHNLLSLHEEQESPKELPSAWIPPQAAPFIGGDISAGYIALCKNHAPIFPFLMADLGTNGEFVLALSPSESLVASVPLGPALEGIGLRHGAVAAPGVITEFTLGPMGLLPKYLPHADGSLAKKRAAISGTGYLSLIYTLLRTGILDEEGRFVQSAFAHGITHSALSPLTARIAKTVQRIDGELRLPLLASSSIGFAPQYASMAQGRPHTNTSADENAYQSLDLSGSDIEEVVKVKAAFSLAVEALLKAAHLPASALQGIYLAGALGLHVNPHDLVGLGFLPSGAQNRVHAVGNTSLEGAKVLLLDHKQRHIAQEWATNCSLLDLTKSEGHSDFTQRFLQHMVFRF